MDRMNELHFMTYLSNRNCILLCINILPTKKSLNISFELRLNVHTYNARKCNKLNVNLCRTKRRPAALSYLGPLLWNSLADILKQSMSTYLSKKTIKLFLITGLNYLIKSKYTNNVCICDFFVFVEHCIDIK